MTAPAEPFVRVTEVSGSAFGGRYEEWPWPIREDYMPDEALPVGREHGPTGRFRITVEFWPDVAPEPPPK